MPWKNSINTVLRRTLNLQIVKAETSDSQESRDSKNRALKKEVAELKANSKPKKGSLPNDYDQEFREIWPLVKPRTMTSHEKGFALYHATNYITRYGIPGAIVECGVWRGGSMLTAAHTLIRRNSTERDLYLFDTYEGMSEPTERDINMTHSQSAADMLATNPETSSVWAKASLEDVQEGFSEISYPNERLHFIKGKVEDSVPEEAPQEIALLRLDTDWYESTKHEFDHLYERLVPGGVLIIDDYGTWQGSREATHEFLDRTEEPIMLVRAGRGRIGVKPGLPGVTP